MRGFSPSSGIVAIDPELARSCRARPASARSCPADRAGVLGKRELDHAASAILLSKPRALGAIARLDVLVSLVIV